MRGFMKWMRRANGQPYRPLVILIILAGLVLQVGAQQHDKRIEDISRISRQINGQIAESERIEESNGIYCNELVVNKGDKSWPAVGNYRSVIKFYYTFGDREKDPYPDRVLKITVTTNRSNRHESAEYLFNPAGQLIYYSEKNGESSQSERRLYFAADRLIRRMTGQRIVTANNREALDAAKIVHVETRKLRQVFRNSLGN